MSPQSNEAASNLEGSNRYERRHVTAPTVSDDEVRSVSPRTREQFDIQAAELDFGIQPLAEHIDDRASGTLRGHGDTEHERDRANGQHEGYSDREDNQAATGCEKAKSRRRGAGRVRHTPSLARTR